MGDVALLVPVLSALASKYTNLRITLVTRRIFEPFFYNIPGVEVIGVDLRKKEYKGIRGLYRLYKELKLLGPYDQGIDVHGSTRSRVIRFFFRFSKLKFFTIIKGRREKRKQTRRKNKKLYPLPHVVERYMNVFDRAGYRAHAGNGPWINPDTQSRALATDFLKKEKLNRKTEYWIGLAPFAGHRTKTWPFIHVHELVSLISRNLKARIFLFGGGEKEIRELERLKESYPDITTMVAGNLSLEGELALLLRLDLMIAMDSFNMHIAALLGRPVLSIWGSTHHYSGFGPYGQGEEAVIEIPSTELKCRPCSIFGNKPCFRRDLACMNWITPRRVYDRVTERLGISE